MKLEPQINAALLAAMKLAENWGTEGLNTFEADLESAGLSGNAVFTWVSAFNDLERDASSGPADVLKCACRFTAHILDTTPNAPPAITPKTTDPGARHFRMGGGIIALCFSVAIPLLTLLLQDHDVYIRIAIILFAIFSVCISAAVIFWRWYVLSGLMLITSGSTLGFEFTYGGLTVRSPSDIISGMLIVSGLIIICFFGWRDRER